MNKKHVVWFEEVGKGDVGTVGGKGANLGEMTQAHFPIPYGFVVTSHAYFSFIEHAGIQPKIKEFLKITNVNNPSELQQASKNIQEIILRASVPREIASQVIKYYQELTMKEEAYRKKKIGTIRQAHHLLKSLYRPPLVAVRSSATAEDLPGASFAGQQETYLNVHGETALIQKMHECWASLFTERAIYYRHEQGFDHFKVGLAAVVERMVQSDKSGIAFSIDPVTNDKSKIVIEAIYGLGEYIVQGKVTPDHYEIDKNSMVILKKEIKEQRVKFVKSYTTNKEEKLSKHVGNQQKLTDQEMITVALNVKDIERHYYFPQDIEWAIEKGQVFIVQARPITTISKEAASAGKKDKVHGQLSAAGRPISNVVPAAEALAPIVSGSPASPGIGVGPVRILKSPSEIAKLHKGDILVASQTNPDYVPAMKKAAAIVTERGGRTSHAAIVSRELGVPAVVGAEGALKLLKDGMIISVDGGKGEVYKGSIIHKGNGVDGVQATPLHVSPKHPHKTLTKVYVNLAEPEQAERIAQLDTDGIGLLRAEFMIAGIGTHPKEFIRLRRQHEYVRKLTHELTKFAKPFFPRPIIYRATDFKTNEYRHLKGGAQYEPQEENPMLGFRGASRYIANPDVFDMELQAIAYLWKMGLNNVHLMIPFVRRPWELIKIKSMVEAAGLLDMPGFRLLIMVEVPAAALELEDFLKIGVDGVSIGTNDLTMMLLGLDRDNAEVAHMYDERTNAVTCILEKIVKTCAAYNVSCSICGQAASDYPDLVEKLVKWGITSVSVNPDAIDRTRQLIYEIERKQFKDKLKK